MPIPTRRDAILAATGAAAPIRAAHPAGKVYRIGVVSATIGGKPQRTNGHAGHHYEMFRMAHVFREMVRTRQEPVPHREILEVTAVIHAGVKSRAEKGRLVALAEVMG